MNTEGLSATARIRIRREPADVFAAFVSAGAMSQFWFTRRDDGLKEGEPCTWFLGRDDDAVSFEIRVQELSYPDRLVIEWENGPAATQVRWSFQETGDGDTILTVTETGFAGSDHEKLERALDSTGGFNQVIVAAKVLIEHGVAVNVVTDHA